MLSQRVLSYSQKIRRKRVTKGQTLRQPPSQSLLRDLERLTLFVLSYPDPCAPPSVTLRQFGEVDNHGPRISVSQVLTKKRADFLFTLYDFLLLLKITCLASLISDFNPQSLMQSFFSSKKR